MKSLGLIATAGVVLVALFLVLSSDGEGRGPSSIERSRVDRPAVDAAANSGPASEGTGSRPALASDRTSPQPTRRTAPAPSASGAKGSSKSVDRVRLRTLTGAVVSQQGPVRGAQVLLYSGGELIGEENVDAKGQFELSFPIPQEDVVLRASQRGFATYEKALGTQRLEGRQLLGNLLLRPGVVLSGRVEDESGRPIHDAIVQLSMLRGRSIEDGVGDQTRTGVDGKFQFPFAPEGSVVLTARAPGFGESTIDHRHLAGRAAKLVLRPGVDLTVRVLDENGQPVPDTRVTVRSVTVGTVPQHRDTDAEGLARFQGLSAQRWNVRAQAAGFQPAGIASVDAGAEPLEIRLVAWPCATGKIVTPDGDPAPPGTRVHALPGATRGDMVRQLSGGTEVQPDGTFRLCDLRQGEYRLHVTAPGFADTASSPFRVGDTGDVRVGRVTLDLGATVELLLTSLDEPAEGVQAEPAYRDPLPAQLWADPLVPLDDAPRSDGDGKLVLEGVRPGNLWLILRSDRHVPKRIGPIPVRSGGRTDPIRVALLPGGKITGFVRSPAGTPAPRARVQIHGPVKIPYISTDERGAYASPPLPPGSYDVSGTRISEGKLVETAPVTVRISVGEDRTADLELAEN